MRTNLYFVRHAHSIYTPEEVTRPLSERGLVEAKQVTELLKMEHINYVITSPYMRATQTVEGIAEYIKKEMIVEENFKERILSEGPVPDFHQAIYRLWTNTQFSFAGGESNYSAQQRGINAVIKILNSEKYKNKNVVIGTHGNLMVLVMNYFDKTYDYNFWKQLDMPDIYKLTFNGNQLEEVVRIWDR